MPAPDALVHREYGDGEPIDLEHGIFFMDLGTGAVDPWSLPAVGMLTTGYTTTDGGRLVFVSRQGPGGTERYLVDRTSETTFAGGYLPGVRLQGPGRCA